jgi:glycosyltransferase involved in cell wall biosynthesis
LPFWQVFQRARRTFAGLKIKICILPSYAPKQSLAALLAAKSLGLRTVMMNESHAGTARARGIGGWVKRRLVGLFDAALVGGRPQQRYFASLGLPQEKIFMGYDAVDNDYFARRAAEIRSQKSEVRSQYNLPEHYFLSLGRFVPKKNLAVLLEAYHQFLLANPLTATHLVMVGSGQEEPKLRALCKERRLPICDKTLTGIGNRKSETGSEPPGVHFYGFRQIEESPVFYALADAFILPSLWEEWGLVVNEAMACGLPVAVSETVGCAEDLLEPGGLPASEFSQTMAQVKQAGLSEKVRLNGFVFDPRSSGELSRVLLILDASPGLRSVMGQASRRIVEKFSCENFARHALRAAQAALGTETKN